MDRNEAVQKLATAGRLSIAHAEDLYDSFFPKPVVPQYVADWYEGHKDGLNEDIWEYLTSWADTKWDEFKYWMYHTGRNKAITTLANMHQFGYEVEKEKRYVVKVKGVAEAFNRLNYNTVQKMYSISTTTELGGVYIIKFTRKELEKAGFGEVFDNPMFEIEEVDDGND
jgi:hypothetical protein